MKSGMKSDLQHLIRAAKENVQIYQSHIAQGHTVACVVIPAAFTVGMAKALQMAGLWDGNDTSEDLRGLEDFIWEEARKHNAIR